MRDGFDEAARHPHEVRGVKRGRFTVTRLHRSGVDPHRVLVVGSASLLAPKRAAAAEALGERIADRIWLRTRRAVDLDLLWELRPVLLAIREGLTSWRLWRYDAVVVIAPARMAGPLARWRGRGVPRLLREVIREVGTATHVLVVSSGLGHRGDAQPAMDRTGDAEDTPRVSYLTTARDAREAADAVAVHLLDPLAAADEAGRGSAQDAAHRRRSSAVDEARRQEAVDELGLHGARVTRRLQQVVDMAQELFDSASAEITIIDHGRQWTMAAAGARRDDAAREVSLCDRAIQQPSPTVIADTWTVPDLRGNPLVSGAGAIRFYAAHHIESVEGYRIGVLCVWDDVPHDVHGFDLRALRDLALLAEGEIITANRR